MRKTSLLHRCRIVLWIIALLWIIHLLGYVAPHIRYMGIHPREESGLLGIVTAPFLHVNFSHLLANSTSLLIFGLLLILLEPKRFLAILMAIAVLGGLVTWLLARGGTNHIGASGVIFGMFGYLLLFGIFIRKIEFILVSILIAFFYGGMLQGILPQSANISWESHLFGFAAGIVVAHHNSLAHHQIKQRRR